MSDATAAAAEPARLAAATSMGPVHLTVSDLERSLSFYRGAVGLELRAREDGRASLGTRDELLVLVEERGARPSFRHTGLFHVAYLLPERRDLAAWLAHAARDRVPVSGASDHYVSEALYLSDFDGHGIEIYWDRPREVWEGTVDRTLTTAPLDLDGLLAELDDPATAAFDGLPPATRVGHVHLRVAEVAGTTRFYRDVLGFELMAAIPNQAAFFAAGGYHHHVGANTWQSAGAEAAPEGTARLLHATVVLPDAGERERVLARVAAAGGEVEEAAEGPLVRDPSGNALVLATA